MKLKYYLRGIGVGLVLAVLFYSMIIIPGNYKLSDDDIIRRAGELGMQQKDDEDVDLSALTMTPEPSPSAEPEATPEATPEVTPEEPEEPEKPGKPSMPELPRTGEMTPTTGPAMTAGAEPPDGN